jgi:transcriptional regulator with XRE-family HTH domain
MNKEDEVFFKKLGKRITALRKEAGYTNQENFASDAGIARAQYMRYELGTNMELVSLLKITRLHKMSLEEFFGEGF